MRPGKIFMGVTLMLLGTFLLLINLHIIPGMTLAEQWPLIIIFIGLSMHFEVLDTHSAWGLLIPGAILLTYGVLLFCCSNFGWHIMRDWWPVFILGVALGLFETYFFGGRKSGLLVAGSVTGLTGLVLLLQNLFAMRNLILPLALICAGLIILIFGFRNARNRA